MSMAVSHTVTVKKLMNTTGFLFGGEKNAPKKHTKQNKNTNTNTNPGKKKKKDNLDQLKKAAPMLTN
jgi:hypothetical protein